MSTIAPIIITTEIDTLEGGADADLFALQNNNDQLQILLVNPPETALGNNQNDSLLGSNGNDGIYGRRGDDTISSFAGDDFVDGETGDDVLFAGQGNDQLIGDTGDDILFGDRGFDQIYGGSDQDLLFGNQDNDILFGDGGLDSLYGGQGNDSLTGGSNSDLILGDRGADTLMGVSRPSLGYTQIRDFNPSEDQIQLSGNAELYQLILTEDLPQNGNEFPVGTAILIVNEDESRQLVAVVEGVTNLSFNQSYFTFS